MSSSLIEGPEVVGSSSSCRVKGMANNLALVHEIILYWPVSCECWGVLWVVPNFHHSLVICGLVRLKQKAHRRRTGSFSGKKGQSGCVKYVNIQKRVH